MARLSALHNGHNKRRGGRERRGSGRADMTWSIGDGKQHAHPWEWGTEEDNQSHSPPSDNLTRLSAARMLSQHLSHSPTCPQGASRMDRGASMHTEQS